MSYDINIFNLKCVINDRSSNCGLHVAYFIEKRGAGDANMTYLKDGGRML